MNLNRLAKVWALTGSQNAGEASAAKTRAQTMLAKEGKTLADVPTLLHGRPGQSAPVGQPPRPGGFSFYDMNNPAHRDAYADQAARRRAERAGRESPERAEVLARYGSEDAALAWTEQEELLRAVVRPWTVYQKPPHSRWTLSIDGHQRETLSPPPLCVVQTISEAYPLPGTITDAAAEYGSWERRDRDLGLVLEDTSDSQLDLPAYLRREIVRALLETELRAASLGEVLIRQRHLIEQEVSSPEIERAVLLDLEHLVDGATAQPGRKEERRAGTVRPKPEQPDMFV